MQALASAAKLQTQLDKAKKQGAKGAPDDGRLTDGQGRTVDFRNTLIVMTSHLGPEYLVAQGPASERSNRGCSNWAGSRGAICTSIIGGRPAGCRGAPLRGGTGRARARRHRGDGQPAWVALRQAVASSPSCSYWLPIQSAPVSKVGPGPVAMPPASR
jgi:hypothetical protein